MSKVPVNDRANEVVRKAAQVSDDGLKYDMRVSIEKFEKQLEINNAQFELLVGLNENILKQLKVMNLHLSLISNNDIEDKDV